MLAIFGISKSASAQQLLPQSSYTLTNFCDLTIDFDNIAGYNRDQILTSSAIAGYWRGVFNDRTNNQGSVTGGVGITQNAFLEIFFDEIEQDVYFAKLIPNDIGTGIQNSGIYWLEVSVMSMSFYVPFEVTQRISSTDVRCNGNLLLPELTASPWARITRPTDQSTVPFNLGMTVQTNTGTSSADNVLVTFNSTNQTLLPYVYDLTQTGLQTENFDYNLPNLDDTITIQAFLRSSTTIVATSAPIQVYARANIVQAPPDIQCDQKNIFIRGFCNVIVFLFYPGELSTGAITGLRDSIKNKPPLGYIVTIFEQLGELNTAATPTFDFGTLPFIDQVFTPIKNGIGVLLWGFWAIWLYNRRLVKIEL